MTRPLTAEVVSIGDEMTSGARLDTNSQWLSRRLSEVGIEVGFQTTVGDTLSHNVDVFRTATARADVVVATGGLGPTRDDLTREALALLIGQPLELRESAMRHIESMFARRKREMPERNRTQAMYPASADEIFNPQGTAPGVDLIVHREDRPPSRIFALPGVPAEMTTMFDQTVVPRLMQMHGGGHVIRQQVMRFFGTGESDMEQLLGDMIARDRRPRIGITVSSATISLRITATGESEAECDRSIDAARTEIMKRVGHFYFGDGDEFEQHHAVEQMMRQSGDSLLVIELGYAAPMGDWFASLGDTPAYRGGLSLAGRDDLARLSGCEDWLSATRQSMQRFEATHALIVDAYPSLRGDHDSPIPAAKVDLIVVRPSGDVATTTVTLGGHPSILQARLAKAGLAFLRSRLAQ